MARLPMTACALVLTFASGAVMAQKPAAPAGPAAPPVAAAPKPAAAAPAAPAAPKPAAAAPAAPAAPKPAAAAPAAPAAPAPEPAQSAPVPADAAPSAEALAPVAEPQAAAGNSGKIACVVGEHPQEFPDSARTATALVCDALRERGLNVGMPAYDANGSSAAYVVSLDQLGTAFFLRVTYEEPIGTVKATRRVSVYDLSEVEVAAPRVAKAITGDKSVDETIAYENVVGSEARNFKKKSGEFVIGGGIAALSMPGVGAFMRPTFNLFGFYETRDWGLGLQGHVGDFGSSSDKEASFSAFSVGGRYYFSEENVTPFVGAGLTLSGITETKSQGGDTYEHLEGSGTSAFVEVGVELFRLHKTHLIASLRVDAPFYEVTRSSYYPDYYGIPISSGVTTPSGAKSRYEVPVLLNVGVGF